MPHPLTRSLLWLGTSLLLTSQAGAAEIPSSQLRAEAAEIAQTLESLPQWVASEQLHGRLGFHGRPLPAQWIAIDLGELVRPEEVVLFPARSPVDSGGTRSSGFPPEIEVEIAEDESFENAVRLGRWQEDEPGSGIRLPSLRFHISEAERASGRHLRVRVFGSRAREGGRGRFFALGEIVVLANGRNVALRRPVTTSGGIENIPRWQAENLTDGYLWCLPGRGPRRSPSNGFHSGIEKVAERLKWVEVDLGRAFQIDEVHLIPAHPQDFADTVGFGFPPRWRLLGFGENDVERVLSETGANGFRNPGDGAVMLPVGGLALRRLRIECPELWQRTDDYLFALAELQAWSGGKNVAHGKAVRALDEVESGIWDTDALTDGFSSRRDLLGWREWHDGLSRRSELEGRMAEIAAILDQRAARTRQRWLVGSLLAVSGLLVGFALLLLVQRREATRSREALRERIAHDLHDELGASLSHLALQSDLARRQLAENDPVRDRLTRLSGSARTTLDNMRDVIWLLAPATGSWEQFVGRVESIVERQLEGVSHEFRVNGEIPTGAPAIEWCREWTLFLKETLTNARRHSRALVVNVALTWKPGSLRLEVRDDGSGFATENGLRSEGLGLKSLSRRAATLGGQLEIESEPGKGTSVHLDAPLRQRHTP